jgi:hypothetical protein
MIHFIVTVASMSGSKKLLTKRRTPIPENITDAGENTCEIGDKGIEEEWLV